MATTNLIFYNSSKADSVALMAEYYYKNYKAGYTLTIKDVSGVTNADIGTYIGTLVAATYTEIFIACACESTAQSTATDTLNLADQYTLLSKLIVASQGTLSDLYENASTYTSATIGLSSITAWTTNSLVGTPDAPTYVAITAGTGSGQLSTIKSNTTTVATIYGTFYAVPDNTSDFKTLTGAKLFVVGQAQTLSTVTKNRSELGWTAMYPTINMPLINYYFAGLPGYYVFTGTSDSFGAATLVDSALGGTTDQYTGYYVVNYNTSTNGYQYGEILSNTSTTLTLTANWVNGTPTGTGTYRIFSKLADCLADIYAELYIMTKLKGIATSSTVLANWTKLIDNNGALANSTALHVTLQDLDYLNNTVLATGKTYLDYLVGGHTLYVP